MAVEPATSRSAELIDFEQARSQHSKQRIQTGLESLIELEEHIARKLRTEHEPDLPSDHSARSLVATEPGPISDPSNFIAVSLSRPDRPGNFLRFEEIRWEFRRIEERLSDIEARLIALDATDHPRLPIENVVDAPSGLMNSSIDATKDGAAARKRNYFGARSPRQWHHEATPFLQRWLTQTSGKIQVSLRGIIASLSSMPREATKGAPGLRLVMRPNYCPQIGKGRPVVVTDGPADDLTTTTALLGALTVLGFFLLIGPMPVNQAPILPAPNHARGSAASASVVAEVKAAVPQTQVKVNSLQTKVALLSPKPISGGLDIRGSRQIPRPHETPDLTPTIEVLHPPVETAPTVVPDRNKDEIEKSAAVGDAQQQYDRATELYKSGDIKGAVAWLEKSARQGNSQAQLQLGNLYLKGAGVARNFMQARKWLETAANNGDAFAMHNLAVLYSGGEGRKPDHVRASDWFRRAAECGVVDSMFNLGLAYADGLGVEKDLIQAYAWFSLAASRGDAKAARRRKEIGSLLDREELYEAKLLGDSFNLAQRSR
ncbi:MAG: sel1 repeat family protein [Alphaproteobacteria bacterium]|nr:sel1 repeat family protein [Alphaproteobacteria bacterium]